MPVLCQVCLRFMVGLAFNLFTVAELQWPVPAWQAKWVARVLSGRAAPLPERAAMEADAAAFYALLERSNVPVRHTHCQARTSFTACATARALACSERGNCRQPGKCARACGSVCLQELRAHMSAQRSAQHTGRVDLRRCKVSCCVL